MITFVLSISPLLGGFFVALMGVSLLATALGLRASSEGFSESIIGLIMAAYFIGFIIGSFVCPPLIRRIGHIRSYTVLAGMAAVAAYSHELWVTPSVWFLLRLLSGICVIGLYLVIESWINAMVPNRVRGGVFSVYMMFTLLAIALGPYLLLLDGGQMFGISAMLLSLGLVPVALTRVVEPCMVSSERLDIVRLYRVSPLGLVGATMAGFINGAFLAMGAVFAHGVGMSTSYIALFMSSLVLGGALLQWPVGRLSDHWERRSVFILVALAAAAFAAAAFLLVERSHPWMLLLMFCYGGMSFSIYPLSVAHVNDHLEADQILAATQAVLLMYGIGAIFGPLLAGVVMEALDARSLLLFFVVAYLLLAGYALLRKRRSSAVVAEAKGVFVPMTRTSSAALPMHPELGQKPE